MVYEIHSLLGEEVERDRLGPRNRVPRVSGDGAEGLRHAAAVIALGEPVKQVVVEEKGVPEDRCSVIYPGIDLAEYEGPGQAGDDSGSRCAEHKVIMYVGSIVHPNQGVPILIDALPRVFAAVPESRCVLVGGPAEAAEEYRLGSVAVSDKLIVLAGQTPAQVVTLTRRADVLVHPRLACRENYSVQSKIAVYLAAGRPIVATDFGDYQQLLGATGAGLLTPVAPEPMAEAIVQGAARSRARSKPGRRHRTGRPRVFRHGPQHRAIPRRLLPRDRRRCALM